MRGNQILLGDALNKLAKLSKRYHLEHTMSLLAKPGMFDIPEKQGFNKIIGYFPNFINWGSMDKKIVCVFNHIIGDPIHDLF